MIQASSETNHSNRTKRVNLLLHVLLQARKQGAEEIRVVHTSEDGSQSVELIVNDKAIPFKKLSQDDISLLKEEVKQRTFMWPDAKEGLFDSTTSSRPSVLLAPFSTFRVLAKVDFHIRDQSLTISDFRWDNLSPIIDHMTVSPETKKALLAISKHKSGIILTNDAPNTHVLCGAAIILALRPDAILINSDSENSNSTIETLSQNNLVVVGWKATDTVDMVVSFLGRFQSSPELRDRIAERLLVSYIHHRARRSCGACLKSTPVSKQTRDLIPSALQDNLDESYLFSRGCTQCGNTAYRGTVGIESVFEIDETLRQNLTAPKPNIEDLCLAAYKRGTRSLLEDGLTKIYSGKSSFEEVFKIAKTVSPAFLNAIQQALKPSVKSASSTSDGNTADPKSRDGKSRLLIIEDDYDQRDILEVVFKTEGFEVVGADNGEEAFGVLDSEAIDVILCDVMMPVMDGIEFVKSLRQHPDHKSIPVLMLTAGANSDHEVELFEHGADDYCSKNIRRKVLLKRVERLLKKAEEDNPVAHLLS
jgi:CheY-like chemotaxis protein